MKEDITMSNNSSNHATIHIITELRNGVLNCLVLGVGNKATAQISAGDVDHAILKAFSHEIPVEKFGGLSLHLEGDSIKEVSFFQ